MKHSEEHNSIKIVQKYLKLGRSEIARDTRGWIQDCEAVMPRKSRLGVGQTVINILKENKRSLHMYIGSILSLII